MKFEIISPDKKVKKYQGKELSKLFAEFCDNLELTKAKSVFRIYLKDGRVKDMILYPVKIKRLLNNKTARVIMEKRLKLMYG